jgi:hypothetical protein
VPNALWDYRLALVSGGSGAEASGSSAYLQLTISLTATLFIGALQLGLAVPLRALMVDGLAARAPLGITLRMAAHRYWHVLWALAAWHCFMLAGFMFCLAPGLMVCFFLLLAPYLASQGASTPDALVESARLARRHSPTVLACVLVGTAYFALTVTTTMETQIAIHESNMVPFEAMISQLAQGLVVDLMSGFFWLFWAVVAVHVETTDRGIPLAE